jgi:hypothetical protein
MGLAAAILGALALFVTTVQHLPPPPGAPAG